jgi:raffinose/stachyose/melibiose transport system substrate-binding protein
MEFLKFLTSKPMAEKMVKQTGWLSVVKGAMNSSNTNPKNIEAAKSIENASNISIWIDAALDSKIVDSYLSGAQQLLNGQQSPEQVMSAVQNAAKQVSQGN